MILIHKKCSNCLIVLINDDASQRGASDSVAYFTALSNPADAQNGSCLGLCGRDICPKSYTLYGLGTFNS